MVQPENSTGTLLLMNIASFLRNLSAIQDREICCYSVSCKEKDNIGKESKMISDPKDTHEY